MALSCALRLKSKSRRRAQTFELLVVVADRPSLRQNCKLAADRTNRLQRPWKPIRKKNRCPIMALTAQRYRIRRRISQLRFLDSALLQPVCEVGRRRIIALRDELLGGPVGEQCLDFRTVLVQLAFAGAFRPSDRQAGRPSRAKGFLRPRGDQPPLDLSGH